ncbi:MAG: ribosome maturation factor RimP [Oscillospiraceae bacterium]|nr:ribosome maturation factor RimP [Oscillospiraceae bacterium]
MSKIVETVRELARPLAEAAGCGLWDVEYHKEGGRWYLRVYIERDEGVSTEHCEQVSRALDPLLDEKDVVREENYILEVSSAGLERALKRPEHFEKSLGKQVTLSFYTPRNGSKEKSGTLEAYDGGVVTLDGERIDIKEIAKINLTFNWEGLTT